MSGRGVINSTNGEAIVECLCTDCGFFFPDGKDEGECRVNPPVVAVIDSEAYTIFPRLHTTKWCSLARRARNG